MSKSATSAEVEEPVVKWLDPFNPVLETPNPLDVTEEQRLYIKEILQTACSDSRFAEKAYLAIMKTLLGEALVPILTSLTPDTEVAGTPSVSVAVVGENFDSGAVVYQAGVGVNTIFVSETELTATLDLSGASAGTLAISVRNSNGVTSNTVNFTVT